MKRGFGRATLLLLFASAAASLSVHACKEPTQVTVEIRTLGFKCSELRRVTVVVARDPDTAESNWQSPQAEHDTRTSCVSDDEVGTLVLTPSAGSGAVMVLASYTEDKCVAPDYKGCIVARRRFSFVDNVRLRLPITLEASCKDVPCNALSSCRSGVCVSSETDCSSDGTCETPAEPVVAADGGTVPPPADATLDIPPNDNYVPPGQDVVEPPIDAGPDVVADADADSPFVSAGDGAPGNGCPTSPLGPDCYATSPTLVCCAEQTLTCKPSVQCDGGPWFPCTGRKYCGTGWCCGTGAPAASGQTSACASDCGGGPILCNTNADCPSHLVCQMSPYTGRGNGVIGKCNPPYVPPDN